jgi:predicted flap endonuclease-1-like 5' DNA nuclease
MKLVSLFTRVGLLALGMILVSVLSADSVWANSSDEYPTTSGLADSLLNDWALPLLILGILMSMAMIGAAYLVRDERMENLLWEFGTGETQVIEIEEEDDDDDDDNADDAVEEEKADESADEEEVEVTEEPEQPEQPEQPEELEEADDAQEAESVERQARMDEELEDRRNRLESLDEKARKKEEELIRVAEKAKTIDFSTLGFASASDSDDLQRIKGVGPVIAEKLNALGIYTFSQLANMTPEIEEEVNVAIEFFPGRIKRDEWANQARTLLGGEEE